MIIPSTKSRTARSPLLPNGYGCRLWVCLSLNKDVVGHEILASNTLHGQVSRVPVMESSDRESVMQ